MIKKADSNVARVRRHKAIRTKISGTAETPRLNVFKSLNNIYAQIIDDTNGVTLVSASSLSKDIEAAKEVGKLIAKQALEKNIASVVFDRGGYLYHGRVAALADGAREGGLKF